MTDKSTAQLLLSDDLGKSVQQALQRLSKSTTFEDFIRASQGPSDLHCNIENLEHPAATLLAEYRDNGASFQTTSPEWDQDRICQAVERGAHQSALQHLDFVRDEFVDMIRKKFWVVLPASALQDVPGLRLSPLGVVPQHERRPRIICDYTYYGVNQVTESVAPPEAMQFGRTLQRVLQELAHADPAHGPVYMGKYDLADGFYRIQLTPQSALALGVILPKAPNEPALVAIPLVLPMGWTESPPAFSSATETVADLANQKLLSESPLKYHRLEELANTPPPDFVPPDNLHVQGPLTPRVTTETPIRYVDVYVDDLIALAQGLPTVRRQVTRAVLHSLDDVFRPLAADDLPARQEPASRKKLQKGDGFMATRKVILGWLIDSLAMTITLTERRFQRLQEILADLPRSRKRVAIRTWHKILGELRSMALAIPGSRGLFSALQFRFKADKTRIRLTTMVHDFLDDFRWLVASLHTRPTRIYELVPTFPLYLGATDASGIGMGGVIFVPALDATPAKPEWESYLWREPFPPDVARALVTVDNPGGSITNSDLELAATVAHHDVISVNFGAAESTVGTLHDNIPAVFWNRKGSTSTTGPAAYLLRIQSLHARQFRYTPLHDFIPGKLNRMADDASRKLHLSMHALLTFFDTHYPQPRPWKACTLRSEISSPLISALHRKRSDPELWSLEPKPPAVTGNCGWSSVKSSPWILGSPKEATLSRSYKSSRPDTVMDASHPADGPFDLAQLVTPYEAWHRRSEAWGPVTHDST